MACRAGNARLIGGALQEREVRREWELRVLGVQEEEEEEALARMPVEEGLERVENCAFTQKDIARMKKWQ